MRNLTTQISEWVPRTNEQHRRDVEKYKRCLTRAAQKEVEQNVGVRYSTLLQLPYFDPVRMCIVDPMHNLLLGTAKYITETWKSNGILTSNHFDIIQKKVDSFVTPTDIGRVPFKISSGFSSFTAEQWKNWIIYFSLFALKDILPWNHYKCWHLFVFFFCAKEQLHNSSLMKQITI